MQLNSRRLRLTANGGRLVGSEKMRKKTIDKIIAILPEPKSILAEAAYTGSAKKSTKWNLSGCT